MDNEHDIRLHYCNNFQLDAAVILSNPDQLFIWKFARRDHLRLHMFNDVKRPRLADTMPSRRTAKAELQVQL
jgi:hypothetical protein